MGEEEVDTPVGKLKGMHVVRESHWTQRDDKRTGVRTWTYWYNAAVKRFVLAEDANVTSDGKVLWRERWELVAYDVK